MRRDDPHRADFDGAQPFGRHQLICIGAAAASGLAPFGRPPTEFLRQVGYRWGRVENTFGHRIYRAQGTRLPACGGTHAGAQILSGPADVPTLFLSPQSTAVRAGVIARTLLLQTLRA